MSTTINSWLSSLAGAAAVAAATTVCGCSAESGQSEPVSVTDQELIVNLGGPDFLQCANEYGTCAIGSYASKLVAFGDVASNRLVYRSIQANTVACNVATFGDPAPGANKKCYVANMSQFSPEGYGVWASGSVAFGVDGQYFFKEFGAGGSFVCDVGTFGDPAPGKLKYCYRMLEEYGYAAAEYQTVTGLYKTSMAFGANGKFLYKVATGSVPCTVAAFGGDPAPGFDKSCYWLGWPFVANEGLSYSLPTGPSYDVFFGSGLNGIFLYSQSGSGSCSVAGFGGDPHLGLDKHCWGARTNPG
jgi:hypothetical protein